MAQLPSLAPLPPHAPLFARVHVLLYRATGGHLGARGIRRRFLLLTTTGRKSGRRYVVPLEYHMDGQIPYIIASNYGKPHPPAWYLNLQAHPLVEIELDRRREQAMATVASPPERDRLWRSLIRIAPHYARYQAGTARQIPIVLLHPAEAVESAP
jgi:deazaflavin-dependent oxidoreductase (nitroreductase family)